jgi:hypothetical protein
MHPTFGIVTWLYQQHPLIKNYQKKRQNIYRLDLRVIIELCTTNVTRYNFFKMKQNIFKKILNYYKIRFFFNLSILFSYIFK